MYRTPVMSVFVSLVLLHNLIKQIPVLPCHFELYIPFEIMIMMSLMQKYSHFRWLDQLEAPLVVLEPEGMAIHLHLLHQWVLLRFLPPRRRFCGSWFKFSNNRGVGIMLITHKKRATKISSVLSLCCSIKRMSLWTRTLGFARSSPSFLY